MSQRRARDYGFVIGKLPTGTHNKITDVPGVQVGHATIQTDTHQTGVTVILPGVQNPFNHKLPAAACQFNGFGKTAGLMQIAELGTLETPIALTNTLNVGPVHQALVEYMVERCAAEEVNLRSVNPVVGECNDAGLNHITELAVTRDHVKAAFADLKVDFAEGCVGAGTGTVCHGLKGGIGSASRQLTYEGTTYTVGVMVQSNHGVTSDLNICGQHIGTDLVKLMEDNKVDQGSLMAVIATDLPLDARQLGRVAKRTGVGLIRMGSHIGHGSGEVFIAFSTANAFENTKTEAVRTVTAFHEEKIDDVFRAVAECAEEAILNSMLTAKTTVGYNGKKVTALLDLWDPETRKLRDLA